METHPNRSQVRSMLMASMLATSIFVLAACPSTPGPKGGQGPGPAAGSGSGSGDGSATPNTPVAPVEGLPCKVSPCMFHPGSGEHHECLNSASGACFQYGRRCVPANKCMQDQTGLYRMCTKVSDGGCEAWGASCEPANSCAFDGNRRSYRVCSQWSAGRCTSYGDSCDPSP